MYHQGTTHNSSQLEVTQMSINIEGQEPHRVVLTASGSGKRQEATQIDLTEAKGHTLKIPVRAGVLLWAWMGMSTGTLCIERA